MWCGVKVALYKEVGGYCELVGYKWSYLHQSVPFSCVVLELYVILIWFSKSVQVSVNRGDIERYQTLKALAEVWVI